MSEIAVCLQSAVPCFHACGFQVYSMSKSNASFIQFHSNSRLFAYLQTHMYIIFNTALPCKRENNHLSTILHISCPPKAIHLSHIFASKLDGRLLSQGLSGLRDGRRHARWGYGSDLRGGGGGEGGERWEGKLDPTSVGFDV